MSKFIDIYKFRDISGFYANSKGNFFTDDDCPLKKEVHEGRLVIRFKGRRYGMKTLRKAAYPAQKKIEPLMLPF